jgi:1-acyl-sn-glycerol-3-phosphate acyltransferase
LSIVSTQEKAAKKPIDFEKYTIRGTPRKVLRAILLAILRVVMGLRVEGAKKVPDGPLLVVSNHLHNADPVLTNIAFPRPLHFMAKKEVFKVAVLRPILHWVGAFPVDRGNADRSAIRRAEAALDRGIAVGMYPEGTRSLTLSLQRAHAGVGLIALRADVPILPLVITGSERLPFNGAKGRAQAGIEQPDPGHKGVKIRFGEAFRIPKEIDGKRTTSAQATELMMVAIAKMLPPDYRGVYAEAVLQSSSSSSSKSSSSPSTT